MTDRAARIGIAILAGLALSAPSPSYAQGRSIKVANCLGGMDRIDLPADPDQPMRHDCCKKGCHAANDRRKKQQDQDGDGCC